MKTTKRSLSVVVTLSLLLTALWSVSIAPVTVRAADELTVSSSLTGVMSLTDKPQLSVKEGATDITMDITWSADPATSATITSGGEVTFQEVGKVTITATVNDSGSDKTGSIDFEVKPVVNEGNTTVTKTVGDTFEQQFSVNNTGGKTVSWSVSGEPNGFSFTDGKLTGTLTKDHIASSPYTIKVKASVDGVESDEVSVTLTVKPKPASNISLDNLTGNVGAAYNGQLSATSDTDITWSVTSGSLPDGLSLGANNGEITGTPKNSGTFVFMVQADNGADTKTTQQFTISIADVTNGVKITDQSNTDITATNISMKTGESQTITAVVDTSNSDKSVTWSNSNTSAVKFESNTDTTVTFQALKAGTATITATSQADKSKTASITVTVTDAPVAVTKIEVAGTSKVNVGGTTTLTATVSPENATEKGVIWSSSNEAFATVDDKGVVTGVAEGTAIITATAKDASAVTGTFSVTVVAADVPVITSKTALEGIKDNPFSEKLTATGVDAANQKWTISDSSATSATVLKDTYGLTLAEDGTLSGKLLKETTTPLSITIRVENKTDSTKYDEQNFTLKVEAALLTEGDPVKTIPSNSVIKDLKDGDKILDDFMANQKAESGKEIKYYFELKETSSPSDQSTVRDKVKELFNGLTTGQYSVKYLDLGVVKESKAIGATTNPEKTYVPDLATVVEIHLSVDSAVTARTLEVIRNHTTQDAAKGVTAFSKLSSRPEKKDWKDASFYASGSDLYIYTRYFSTFAFAYTTVDTWKVSFQANGGSAVSDMLVQRGQRLVAPTAPTREGYTFGGWYKDAALTNEWVMTTDTVTSDVTLYAKWEAVSNVSVRSTTNAESARNTSVRGSQTGDDRETKQIIHLLAMTGAAFFALGYLFVMEERRKHRI